MRILVRTTTTKNSKHFKYLILKPVIHEDLMAHPYQLAVHRLLLWLLITWAANLPLVTHLTSSQKPPSVVRSFSFAQGGDEVASLFLLSFCRQAGPSAGPDIDNAEFSVILKS